MNIRIPAAFAAGAIAGAVAILVLKPGHEHVREEIKMAFMNRALAIERGDRAMQTYFEETIAWNALMHAEPEFFRGSYRIDWLDQPVEEPPYHRLKDGMTYAELRKC